MIRYVCLEGPEVGTYFRGSGRIVGGLATVEVPESFRMVTSDMGITVQLTPVGDLALLAVMSSSLDRIVVRGSRDVEFHYMVNGVRKAFPDHEAIQENDFFIPRWPNDSRLAHLPPENLDRLKHNGTLNPDGTLNMDTVRRLGWDKRPGWRETQPATDRVAATAR
jgi:hypothetical protein